MTNLSQLETVLADSVTHSLTLVGGQFGDEGKGKIADILASSFDAVVGGNGGANAGHTVVLNDGQKLVSHQIPSGLRAQLPSVLARGKFVDVPRLLSEIKLANTVLGNLPEIIVDSNCPVCTPYHVLLEIYIENCLRNQRVGTTGRAIGPMAGLDALRIGPRVHHLYSTRQNLKTVLENLHRILTPCFVKMLDLKLIAPATIPSPSQVIPWLKKHANTLMRQVTVTDSSNYLHDLIRRKNRFLLEMSQSTGLDRYCGTYPFVSSGNAVAGGAPVNLGLPPQFFDTSMLVFKAFPTRVGAGPFPSEIMDRESAESWALKHQRFFQEGAPRKDFLGELLKKINAGHASPTETGQYIQVLGNELGASTGRGRSPGFLDLFWLQYAIRINGPRWLALTRFDMLSGLKTIPVVTGYKLNGRLLKAGTMPTTEELFKVQTIKEFWKGWETDIAGFESFDQLPRVARRFITKLEQRLNTHILIIGTGPKHHEFITKI